MTAKSGFEAFIERWYLSVALSLWFLMPEVRRLIDWQVGPNAISLLSVIPLLFLVPLIVPVLRSLAAPQITLPYRIICYSWLFAFVYGLVVAFAAGGRLEAIFQFLQFCLPFVCGTWVLTRRASRAETFAQINGTFLWLGAVIAAYGIYQFVAPPPWDVAWVNFSGMASIGVPEPFGLRVFSTLNSPGTAAVFFVAVALIGLHGLDLRRPGPVISVMLCIAALALTNTRSAWLALVVGILTFFIVSPKRAVPALAMAAISLASIVFAINASTLLGGQDVSTQLIARLDTLSDVDSDYSVNDRRRESAEAVHKALAEPLGQGLGTVGTATKLGAGGGELVLDNGYLSRFVEMGVAGFVAYLITLGCGLVFCFRALIRAGAQNDRSLQRIAATALAVQMALLGLDLSGDAHLALAGLIFWLLVALSLRHEPQDDEWEPAQIVEGRAPPVRPNRTSLA